ncbi:hypothetical protein FS837_004671 [Tulasnella sp. UAMH 9824]|nr:hypothetical protein FS837_004671 [Tulasnella sp. UAMH 9824]
MRSSSVVFFTASLASAYIVLKRQTQVPACAQTCLTSADISPCNSTDVPCICLNENWIMQVGTCVQGSCSAQDAQAAEAAGVAECKAAGVDPTNPWPACAQPCVQNTPTNCEDRNNTACLCIDSSYYQTVTSCVQSSCTGQDLTNAETTGSALCRANGVIISSTAAAA